MRVSRILDKKRITTTGENAGRYHIKIRLTRTVDKKTTQHCYKTGLFATEDEFKKIMAGKTDKDDRLFEMETKLLELYETAKQIIKEKPFVDPETFGVELTNAGSFKDPLSLMAGYAKALREEGNVGNAMYYEQALSSFRKFVDEKYRGVISFGAVTPKWLFQYEKWMREQPRSITTVGMYCTAMRTIFNLAIERKKLSQDVYPFGKGKYTIPTSKGRKLALNEEQKDKMLSFRSLVPGIQKAVDFWVFSYFCYGMNFADLARLKFRDLKDNFIVFDRAKTVNTERDRSFIEIPIRPEVWDIIKRWGNFADSMNQNAFVFPVLRDGLTPEQVKDRVKDFIKDTNNNLELACADPNLSLPKITTYWARHTFATIAYKKGAGLEFIQKALGHSDIKTTQRYINSFDVETKRMVSGWL